MNDPSDEEEYFMPVEEHVSVGSMLFWAAGNMANAGRTGMMEESERPRRKLSPELENTIEALNNGSPAILLPLLHKHKEELGRFLFDSSGLDVSTDVRKLAMTWLLVLPYIGDIEQLSRDPMELVQKIGDMAPHKICQHAFKKYDIVWICKDCQKDDTCVLCNNCFRESDHEGHEVYFYHTQAGGCCDCGDEDAWDPRGFCPRHGREKQDPLQDLPPSIVESGRALIGQSVDFLIETVKQLVDSHLLPELVEGEDIVMEDHVLVVHYDDVHTSRELVSILEEEFHIPIVQARHYIEKARERGEVAFGLKKKEELLQCAHRLKARKVLVSMPSRALLRRAHVAMIHLNWLYRLAGVSGGICRLVCEQLRTPTLNTLMRCHARLYRGLMAALHTLYLFLMADQMFKCQVAQSYAITYRDVTRDYAIGVGVSEFSLYSLSVQFLNRPSFVNELVVTQDFLSVLAHVLQDTINQALTGTPSDGRGLAYRTIKTDDLILMHRRYSPIIADLKFMLNIEGVAERFVKQCLPVWLDVIGKTQYMHEQERELRQHVEIEKKDWMYAFNIQISLCSILEYMLNWIKETDPKKPSSQDTMSVLDIGKKVLEQISLWNDVYIDHLNAKKEGTFIKPPRKRSFHIILQRFFGHIIREATRNPKLNATISQLLLICRRNQDLLLALVDVSLAVLSLSAEIRVGLWRKNGQVMMDQVVNYCETPFCRMFRDVEIINLQFAGLGFGPDKLAMSILLHHGVYSWLLGVERDEEAANREEYMLPLAEEAVILLILLVTELPLPPWDHDTRVAAVARREVIHRLVSGPCTYSEVQDCCQQQTESSEMVTEQKVQAVLAQVAVRKEGKEMEAEKFELKPESWTEYDPAFYHISVQAHQQASELRPKSKGAQPVVGPPPEAHEVFVPLRLGLLSSETVMIVIRTVLKQAESPDIKKSSATLLFRAIHLLTLGMHVARSIPDMKGIIATECGDEDEDLQALSYCETFFKLLRRGVGESKESILLLLYSLSKKLPSRDVNMGHSVQWLLEQCRELDRECQDLLERVEDADEEASKEEMQKRKAQARQRAIAAVQKNAASFKTTWMAELQEDEEEEELEDLAGTPNDSKKGTPSTPRVEIPECISCRTNNNEPIGYIASCQRSNLLTKYTTGRADRNIGSFISLCGHAMHYSCFDQYFATVVEQSELCNHLILDVDNQEFQCPFCKSLANMLVPIVREEDVPVETIFVDIDIDQNCAIWMNERAQLFKVLVELPAPSPAPAPPIINDFLDNLMQERLMIPVSEEYKLESGCSSIAYTLSVISAEFGHSLLLGSPDFSLESASLERLRKVVLSLQWVLRCRHVSTMRILNKVIGMLVPKSEMDMDTGSDVEAGVPLLGRNVFKILTLLLLSEQWVGANTQWSNGGFLAQTIRTMYISRVVQLLIDTNGLDMWGGSAGGLFNTKVLDVVEMCRSLGLGKHALEGGKTGWTMAERIALIEKSCKVFLQSCALLLFVLDKRMPPWPAEGATLDKWEAYFKVPTLGEMRSNSCYMDLIKKWVVKHFEVPHRESALGDYPIPDQVNFMDLKSSYTDLHSDLTGRTQSDHPALCLICNEALSAERRGECTKHARKCGLGTGVVFLLQECSVLLIYGKRACYFPSPYVDAYGERHKQSRGRPLHLDRRRLEALRKLWAKQRIGYEVVHSRSTSKQVIYNEYY